MPMSVSRLADNVTAKIIAKCGAENVGDQQEVKKFATAIAEAMIEEMQANAQPVVTAFGAPGVLT